MTSTSPPSSRDLEDAACNTTSPALSSPALRDASRDSRFSPATPCEAKRLTHLVAGYRNRSWHSPHRHLSSEANKLPKHSRDRAEKQRPAPTVAIAGTVTCSGWLGVKPTFTIGRHDL